MKYLKLTIVFALIIGLLAIGWFLLTMSTTDTETETGQPSGMLDERERQNLDARIARFSSVWNDTAFSSGRMYITSSNRISERRSLADYFYINLLSTVDGAIRSRYAQGPRYGVVDSDDTLKNLYHGMEQICVDYAMAGGSDRASELRNMKDLYNEIYTFSRGYGMAPRFRLTKTGTGTNSSLTATGTIGYANHRQMRLETLRRLTNRRVAEFSNIGWMNRELSQRQFQAQSDEAQRQYNSTEAANIVRNIERVKAEILADTLIDQSTRTRLDSEIREIFNRLPNEVKTDNVRNTIALFSRELRQQ